MKCPNCKETDHAPDAGFCHVCGCKLKKRRYYGIWFVLSAIAFISLFFLIKDDIFQLSASNNEPNLELSNEKNQVKNAIRRLCEAEEQNNFEIIANAYADKVNRYHDKYNVSNSEVVSSYKKYDKTFGVYGKHINIRWNSLQVNRISDYELSVIFIEDYHIDRTDKTKYSKFVLEKHILLDKDYRIKSIYDVQLSKGR